MQYLTLLVVSLAAIAVGSARAADDDQQRRLLVPKEALLPVTDRNPAFQGGLFYRPSTWQLGATGQPRGSVEADSGVNREVTNEASSSHEPSEPRAFTLHSARRSGRWGPLKIGESKFSFHPYPLDLINFEHLYDREDLIPANFEEMMFEDQPVRPGTVNDVRRKRLQTSGTIFRPEPAVLESIQQRIWRTLAEANVRPYRVDSEDPHNVLVEGQYLWPPVDKLGHPVGAMDIPSNILTLRFRPMVPHRFKVQLKDPSKPVQLFHLEVQSRGLTRHILMSKARSNDFVEHTHAPKDSQLWFFFEGVMQEASTGARRLMAPPGAKELRRRMAFLGATYLPNKATTVLVRSAVITPAFADHLRAMHP